MISPNAEYWIWITLSLGYNNPKIKKLCELYSDISVFYTGGEAERRYCGFLSRNDLAHLNRTSLDSAHKIIDRCVQCGYSIICIDDDAFPECLYNIECPPALIYVSGRMPDVDHTFSVGIVGTRRATRYGISNAYSFAYALSKYGTIIVSGGALGVDGASHRGALATDGVTICVRGCGLNCSYLKENADIRATIPKRGAVISEYPPDETPRNYYFPARNRIISALSDGLIVMEAGEKSGSLITARLAAEQGKVVFALLGNNSPQNKGSNTLIKEGLAVPVTDFMDVLCEFDGLYATSEDFDIDGISLEDIGKFPVKGAKQNKPERIYLKPDARNSAQGAKHADAGKLRKASGKPSDKPKAGSSSEGQLSSQKETAAAEKQPVHRTGLNLPPTAQKIYERIGAQPVHIDVISADLNIPVNKVLTSLTLLEMKGLVSAGQGRMYMLK